MPKLKVVRTDPELWEVCKKEGVEKLGKFSARAMQQAVILYKKRGGEYMGEKSNENWSKEQTNS
jgi:hypothetical protein